MNRRGFFSRTAGAIAAAIVAPYLPITPTAPVFQGVVANGLGEIGTYEGIPRSTYAFWRNQPDTILSSSQVHKAYESLLTADLMRAYDKGLS